MEGEGKKYVSYVLEAAVKDLQLLAGESRLGLQLFQALGAMPDRREFELIFNAVCKRQERPDAGESH